VPVAAASATQGPSHNVCGWILGYVQEPYSCAESNTCYWNADPDNKVIACGITASTIAFNTKCIAYADLSASCDLTCSFDPSINRCSSTEPYWVTVTVGGDYTAYACGSSKYATYAPVELTYSGQTTVNTLPRFLEADGSISYGTQSPPSTTTSTATSTATTSTQSTSPTSSSPAAIGASQTPSTSSALTSSSAEPTSQQSTTAIIAGSVVGGVVVISIIAGVIIWRIIRQSKNRNGIPLVQPLGPKPFVGYYAPAQPEQSPIGELPASPHAGPAYHELSAVRQNY